MFITARRSFNLTVPLIEMLRKVYGRAKKFAKCGSQVGVLSTVVIASAMLSSTPVEAAARTDGTVGPVRDFSGDFTIDASVGTIVDDTNLFHSFDTFSVLEGERATFTGPNGLNNVISRVTGGQESVINGTLSSWISNADFWFLNPAGVLFGPNAFIDVPGSFHVSTADELRFEDGYALSASSPSSPETLTVEPPEAFGFLDSTEPGRLRVEGEGIEGTEREIRQDQTFSLVGGNVDIHDVNLKVLGNLQIAAAGPGSQVTVTDQDIEVTPTGSGSITVGGDTFIAAGPEYTGRISIRGGRFVMENSATITDVYFSNPGDGIDINADEIRLDDSSLIDSTSLFGTVTGNPIRLVAKNSITLSGSSSVSSYSQTSIDDPTPKGTAAPLIMHADDAVILEENATIRSVSGHILISSNEFIMRNDAKVESFAFDEPGQNIEINVGDMRLHNDAYIRSNSYIFATGNVASVQIEADRSVMLTDDSRVSSANFLGFGQAGSISIVAGDTLELKEGAAITSLNWPLGGAPQGASIKIEAGRSVAVKDRALVSAAAFESGSAGKVDITSPKITLSGEASIASPSVGAEGGGGDVSLHVDVLEIEGGNLGAQSTPRTSIPFTDPITGEEFVIVIEAEGPAGTVTIRGRDTNEGVAKAVTLTNGFISVSSASPDQSGLISVAAENIMLNNATITAEVTGDGKGGGIELVAQGDLSLQGGTAITAKSTGLGDAGNIRLQAGDIIQLDGSSEVKTEAELASGGNITLQAPFMIEMIDSEVSSSVFGPEGTQGGDIRIDPQFLILDSSEILARAFEGRGGNIRINADYIIQSAGSRIDASADRGIDGTVVTRSPEVDLQKGLVELPVVFVDAASQVRQSCEARRTTGESELTVVGRGGLPPDLTGLMPAFYALSDTDGETDETSRSGQAGDRQFAVSLPAPVAISCSSFR